MLQITSGGVVRALGLCIVGGKQLWVSGGCCAGIVEQRRPEKAGYGYGCGERSPPWNTFERFLGRRVLLEELQRKEHPHEGLHQHEPSKSEQDPLFRLFRQFWKPILVALVLSATAGATASMAPTMIGNLYDVVSSTSAAGVRPPLAPFLRTGVFFLASALLRAASFECVMRLGSLIQTKLQAAMLASCLRQDMQWIEQWRPGELAEQMRMDTSDVKRLVTTHLASAVGAAGQLGCGISLIFSTSPALAGVILCSLPPGVLIVMTSLRKVMRARKWEKEVSMQGHSQILQTLLGVRTVRSFAGETRESRAYEAHIARLEAARGASTDALAVYTGTFMTMQLGACLLWIFAGGVLCSNGQLTVGKLSSVIQHSQQLGSALGLLSSLHEQIARARDGAKRIYDMIDHIPTIEGSGTLTLKDLEGCLRFKNVTFSYPSRPNQPVLKNLHLSLYPGIVTAVVGGSGSGKSTLTLLLQRFYDPSEGEITVDGVPLKQLDLEWVRSNIGIVSQEPSLFPGTIEENIRYGKPDATDEEVKHAAYMANAHLFIEQLEEGYQTLIHDKGATLSGGQKQRIAIAR